MMKRTIKPAAGDTHVTAEAARAAARAVYRDSTTGKLVVSARSTSAYRRTESANKPSVKRSRRASSARAVASAAKKR